MGLKQTTNRRQLHWVIFFFSVALVLVFYGLYVFNMVQWRNSADFGWIPMFDFGPNVVAEVFAAGEKAGLQEGDVIKEINGHSYTSFYELFFEVRNHEPGSINTYLVEHEGRQREIQIITDRIGAEKVLQRCGPLLFIGLAYVLIGCLVFMMKPQDFTSWIFFVMCSLIGLKITYSARVDFFNPMWLFDARNIFQYFFIAPMIHLALLFPKQRTLLKKYAWIWVVPYIISGLIFFLRLLTTSEIWDNTPPFFENIWLVYLLFGILFFPFSMVWNFLRDKSHIIRLQSQVIFIGILFGFLLPVFELIMRHYWDISVFPNPSISFAVLLSFFPMSIGYTIVRHDLFAIDTIVRRTYGYILSTASIIGMYAIIVSILNVTFKTSDIYRSPLFSIGFALFVVFSFRPIHERIQGVIDRVFYRQAYDYRKTIKSISEAMIRILDPEQIYHTLVGSVVQEMSLENGLLLLPDPEQKSFRVQVVEGDGAADLMDKRLAENDDLAEILGQRNDALLQHQVALHPDYEGRREELQNSFNAISSVLMLPLKYQDEMRGIMSLGPKKSGKMFLQEDLDLIKTITNQSVIALENAKLFEENLEKTRMEEELKIAHDIQVSMLPKESPEVAGYTIAASSYPAREVGGDFYDFIETGSEEERKLGIIVGDVAGKAVSGALVMAAARSIFRV
ncbi:MAG: GAF domain-containing protein, partial [Desulfobulbales bacterium]|nr:GAF domain-containing protein [Desulfobulbales bacterium]